MAITVPQWFQELREGPAEPGLRWYTAAEREARFAAARAQRFDPRHQWLGEETVALATVLRKDKLAVGEGPPIYLSLGTEARVRCWLDLRAPDQLWLSLDRQPPFLWIPAGREPASLRRALAPYLPADLLAPRPPEPVVQAFARQREAQRCYDPHRAPAHNRACRLLLGIALDRADLDLVQVENHLTANPFCDAEFVFQGTADWNTQENPTVTVVRTNYSRSVVRLSWYEGLAGTLFAEIEYAAAGQGAVIAAYNRQFDHHFPLDIPVDVPSMLLGFAAIDVAALQRQMQETEDEEVRRGVVAIAENNDLHDLLRGMLQTESNALLRARIAAALPG